ncbi:C3-degrading proteinase [Streptococcus sp. HSISB1]|nr:C3-degrading proteinase [Streptococcus sp. HSISB1]
MTLFNGVTFRHPVLRINNRDQNVDFYQRLGFKLVHEENAIAVFSTKQRNARFVIEESPAPWTRAVKGDKKLIKLLLKFLKLMKSKQF